MFFFMISCFSFILIFCKSFSLNSDKNTPLSNLSTFLLSLFQQNGILGIGYFPKPSSTTKNVTISTVKQNVDVSLLDLPELVLDCIFERIPPFELLKLGSVCRSLRVQCGSDHLWVRHLKEKWGSVIGDAAYREWQCHIASKGRLLSPPLDISRRKGLFGNLLAFLGFSPIGLKSDRCSPLGSLSSMDSVMALYVSLENGQFWFPAQVYNREVQNGHAGFMLSCYDAKLSYNSGTDSFMASYTPTGRPIIEENIGWNRVRVPTVDTPPNALHIFYCLSDLKPGDHIEIQWRRNKEFPYGWWYGVVGHLESCDWEKSHCKCHNIDTMVLEFKQYNLGSRWRHVLISRKDHREVGNETDGFYGGIRKLYCEEEIFAWKHFWPTRVME